MTTECLSTKISACCETLALQEAWVVSKKPALKAVLDAFEETTRDSKEAVSVDILLPLAAPMAEHLLPSCRTETVQSACMLLLKFVNTLGVALRPFADQMVVPLLSASRKMRRRPIEERRENPNLPVSKLVDQSLWQSAETCLDAMSSKSRYDLVPMLEYYDACHSVSVRSLILKQVGIILGSWTKGELEPYFDRLRDLLHEAMYDRYGHVRMAARAAFCQFCDTWSEHMDDLVHIPPPQMRRFFVAFHPGHCLSNALTHGATSVVQEIGKEDDMAEGIVEDDTVGARVDEALDVHLSVVLYFLVHLMSTLWSFHLLVGNLWWSIGVLSKKTQVTPMHVHADDHSSADLLCEDQRYEDHLRRLDNNNLDKIKDDSDLDKGSSEMRNRGSVRCL